MTLLQTLLQQRLILLSLGGTALLLLLAMLLVMILQVRAAFIRRAERQTLSVAEDVSEELENHPDPIVPSSITTPIIVPQPVTAPAVAPVEIQNTENIVSDSMKDLLSVFVDDNSTAKRAVLLSDLPEVSIHDLLALANRVIDKLTSQTSGAAQS